MLSDTVCVVTGGSTGIGRAIAADFVDRGAEVVIANRTAETGERTADELGCTFFECDVADYSRVERLVESTVEEFGRLDTVVNNAGIGHRATVEDMTLEEWQAVIDVNLSGVMHGTRAALPHLKRTEGSIVNVASILGLVGGPATTAYSAAKGGVVNFTRTVALDYAEEGVRANCVCPGFVRTPMTADELEDESFYEFVREQTPMGRVADPEEVAGAVAFLASDEASYITGVNLPIDGGWTAH